MAYRLKLVKYKTKGCHILLQNENGPCPLLAAANVLLLKRSISLPSNCIGAGVVTIEELTNVLGEKILMNQPTGSALEENGGGRGGNDGGDDNNNRLGDHHHIQEVLQIFPTLQYGMDVNPKFNSGPTGMEYTKELDAFDLLHIELVHGWLLDPAAAADSDHTMFHLIGESSYNQLVNTVIEGNDAAAELERNPDPYAPNHDELSTKATKGSVIRSFLESSGHQLTQYGLQVLHEYVQEGDMKVLFRNNHFNTLTKHSDGHLYLLVTDIGFADLPSVVWEKLDVIDGDTEYVTGDFKVPPPTPHMAVVSSAATGEQLLANNPQSQADYQLALQLSRENENASSPAPAAATTASVASTTGSTWSEMLGFGTTPTPPTTTTPPSATLGARQVNGDSDLQRALQASLMDQQPLYEQHQPNPTGSQPTSQRQPPQGAQDGTFVSLPPAETSNSPHQFTPSTSDQGPGTHPQNMIQQPQFPVQQMTSAPPTVAVGVPAKNLSQEDQDMILAMQLQRQEEQERQASASVAALANDDQASQQLALAMQRQEHSRQQQRQQQQQRVAQPAPPPHRQPTAVTAGARATRGSKDNCVIS